VANVALLGVVGVQGSMSLLVSGQVAARCIVLTTLGTGVLWFGYFWTYCDVFRSSITREEGLVGVSSRFAPVESKDRGAVDEISLDITVREGGGEEG